MDKIREILQNKSVAMINLGCKVNKYEADAMMEKLGQAGMMTVEADDVADVYIVNTCSVTNMAQKKSRQMLRRAKKRNPEAIVIAAGCYVNAEKENLEAETFVDLVVGNNCKKDIVDIVAGYFENQHNLNGYVDINHTSEYEEMGSLVASVLDHQRAYIKIQDGCNQFCSYCIIPYTRGRVRSRKPELILQEIEQLAKDGVKEFVLTGIHISSYGLDFEKNGLEYDELKNGKGNRLGELIYAIEQIPEVKRVRLGSLEPRIITREFIELIGKSEKLCPHFHLSLQSACNDTLKRMNRKYTIEEFMDKCDLLREYFDKPAITTDVIVGFPGETNEEFEITVDNLEQLSLYELHVFKYSVRSGTVAEKMPNQVSEQIKNERSERLLKMTEKQKKAYEENLHGMVDEVLIEERDQESEEEGNKALYVGHTKRYVKMRIPGDDSIINQILEIQM